MVIQKLCGLVYLTNPYINSLHQNLFRLCFSLILDGLKLQMYKSKKIDQVIVCIMFVLFELKPSFELELIVPEGTFLFWAKHFQKR